MVKTEQKKIIKQETSSSSSSPTPKQMPSSHMSAGGESKKMRKYKGVRMRSWGSWVSEIRAPNQKTRIWLGSYSTAEAAARAYDAALLCLKGSSANLNFPITSSHYIPSDTVMSPKSIQRVAAAAANSAVNSNVTDINVLSSSTSPASFSSPSLSSSSPSDPLLDDDVSALMQSSFGSYSELPMTMEPFLWYNNFDGIQSPKYVDQMFINGVSSFDPPLPLTIDDYLLEEGDIRLWSFC